MKINVLSDFKIVEKIDVIGVPFKFTYYVWKNVKVASYDGLNYFGCKPQDDGTIVVPFDRELCEEGVLKVRREFFLNDHDFADGVCNKVTEGDVLAVVKDAEGNIHFEKVELVSEPTDGDIKVDSEVETGMSVYVPQGIDVTDWFHNVPVIHSEMFPDHSYDMLLSEMRKHNFAYQLYMVDDMSDNYDLLTVDYAVSNNDRITLTAYSPIMGFVHSVTRYFFDGMWQGLHDDDDFQAKSYDLYEIEQNANAALEHLKEKVDSSLYENEKRGLYEEIRKANDNVSAIGQELDLYHYNKQEIDEKHNEIDKEISTKAPLKGYAPDLKVNFANELVGRGVAEAQEIGKIRPTGVISIGDGNATIEKIKGKSVVWNQCMDITRFYASQEASLYTITHNDGKYYVAKQEGGTSSNDSVTVIFSHEFKEGQKYLLRYNLSRNDNQNLGIIFFGAGIYDGTSYHNLIKTNGQDYVFFSPTSSFKSTLLQISQRVTAGVALSYTIAPVIYDLTKMFGTGNEPTTIEEFEARKPLGVSDEYNEGTIISYDGANELKSVGFNAYNGAYAKVIGGQKYHALGAITSIGFTTELGGETTAITLDSEGMFTPAEDGYVYAEGSDICIHLTHTYTPEHTTKYEEDTLQLPDVKAIKDKDGNQLFPYGLLSAGSAHDEITATKAIKRVGVVDMGTLNWLYGKGSSWPAHIFYAENITAKEGYNTPSIVCCYTRHTNIATMTNKGYKTGDSNKYVYVRDDSYTSIDDFKQAMQGVLLYYALAEPIEVELQKPLNLSYEAWDFGTEELVTEGTTTPLNADIVYLFNAVDRIRENTKTNAALEKRIAQLESILTQISNENSNA